MHAFERVIHGYVHNGRIGVLVELAAQTDWAIRSSEFKNFAHEIALHIAAAAPDSVANLLEQSFVMDDSQTIAHVLSSLEKILHEQVEIIRFVRWDTEAHLSPNPDSPQSPALAKRA